MSAPSRPAGAVPSDTALDAGSQSALIKLGLFTVAMVAGPIGTYFLSLKHVWGEGNTTQAAVSAAIAANVVLFGYIITALKEDQQEKQQVETRKTQ